MASGTRIPSDEGVLFLFYTKIIYKEELKS